MSACPKEKDKDPFWSLFTSSIRVAFSETGGFMQEEFSENQSPGLIQQFALLLRHLYR
jgi:hypothetical protein